MIILLLTIFFLFNIKQLEKKHRQELNLKQQKINEFYKSMIDEHIRSQK
jgi:hypothetical protein